MDSDLNLLFGVLALQLERIDCRQFADACCGWGGRRDEALEDLLLDRGWISASDRAEIEQLVVRKLRRHAGDARASLNDLWGGFLRDALSDDRSGSNEAAAGPLKSSAAECPTRPRVPYSVCARTAVLAHNRHHEAVPVREAKGWPINRNQRAGLTLASATWPHWLSGILNSPRAE
jgi:hypothetical protein